jgi:ABC-2 type transport system ATP-binding protein
MPDAPVIQTRALTKYFGGKCVVDSLTLAVPRGSVFAFLGRNGSGKTTTIRMLLGLLPPTRGGATILGHDITAIPPAARARIGYLAEGHQVFPAMTVAQSEAFQSAFFPTWNHSLFAAVTRHFELTPKMKASSLSRGQRAGLALALCLAPDPDLLILDDPALGLDPVARRSLLESMLYVTRRQGRTILFSSHLLSDVERVADYVAVLDRSVLRASCTVEAFRTSIRQFLLHFAGVPPVVPAISGLVEAYRTETDLRITLVRPGEDALRTLHNLGALSVAETPLSLEDAFITYIGQHGQRSFFLETAAAGETL